MCKILSSKLFLVYSFWIYHPLLLVISWSIHGIDHRAVSALSFLEEESFSEYFEADDLEDGWKPPFKLIALERQDENEEEKKTVSSQHSSSTSSIDHDDKYNKAPEDHEEGSDQLVAPNIIPAKIEKRRIEAIQSVDILIDCNGEAIDKIFIQNIHKTQTAPVSPMVFALLTNDDIMKKRGEKEPSTAPWSWDALASVCHHWLKEKELMHRTINVKCFPLVPDSIMFASTYPWDSKNMWEYLKNKREIQELHMDEMTMEPVTFDRDGLFAYIQPYSFGNIPDKPKDAPRTREELDWWASLKQRAERRRRQTFGVVDYNVRRN